MTEPTNFVNVKVNVNGKTQTIKMEKGTSFSNKGGIFIAGEDQRTLNLTNYQLKFFEAMANNSKENGQSGIVLSKKDIEIAMQKFKNGEFTEDMSEFLPTGYKIEKPVLKTKDNLVQAYVTNGKDSQSATLKFQIVDESNKTTPQTRTNRSSETPQKTRATKVSPDDLKRLDPDNKGAFYLNDDGENLPLPIYGGGEIWDRLRKYNGEKITPDLIDKLTNEELNYEKEHPGSMRWTEGTANPPSMLIDIGEYAEYLKPETIDKLLKVDNFNTALLSVDMISDYYDDSVTNKNINNLKNLYNHMNKEQKEKYYETIFSKEANYVYSAVISDYQASGTDLAKITFEEKVSPHTFNCIKSFVSEMNTPGNKIARTGTECKNLIDTLLQNGQITKAQAQELYKAARINK